MGGRSCGPVRCDVLLLTLRPLPSASGRRTPATCQRCGCAALRRSQIAAVGVAAGVGAPPMYHRGIAAALAIVTVDRQPFKRSCMGMTALCSVQQKALRCMVSFVPGECVICSFFPPRGGVYGLLPCMCVYVGTIA